MMDTTLLTITPFCKVPEIVSYGKLQAAEYIAYSKTTDLVVFLS